MHLARVWSSGTSGYRYGVADRVIVNDVKSQLPNFFCLNAILRFKFARHCYNNVQLLIC